MKDEKKLWEDLIEELHQVKDEKSSATNLNDNPDLKWAAELKGQLNRVFKWDSFNEDAAKRKLDRSLRREENVLLKFSRRQWARAAVLLIAILSGAVLHALIDTTQIESGLYTEILVPKGQMTQINLSDGTQVWLNSGSKFRYPNEFGKASRDVFVDGEAFMEVAKDTQKPFTVTANDFSLEVLGTSFNVTAYSEDNYSNVTLVEGSVALNSEDKSWSKNLIPGQSQTIVQGHLKEIKKVNTDFYTSWKDGKIVFRKEKLEVIAKKMERWYNVEIEFENEALKGLTFSGTFLKYKPVEQVFRTFSIMNNTLDFKVQNRAGQQNIITITNKRN